MKRLIYIAQSGEIFNPPHHARRENAQTSRSCHVVALIHYSELLLGAGSIRRSDVLSSPHHQYRSLSLPNKEYKLKIKFYNLTNEVTDSHYHMWTAGCKPKLQDKQGVGRLD